MILHRRTIVAVSPPCLIHPVCTAAVLFTVLILGCGKKEESTVQPQVTNTVTSASVVGTNSASLPAAPVIFPDREKQTMFENIYYTSFHAFAPPKLGTLVRVIKTNGGRVEGELSRIDESGIVISTEDSLVSISREEMSEATRATLYAYDFSRNLAEQQVRENNLAGDPITMENLFLKPESNNVKEVRRFTANRMVAKYGPGREYADIEGAEIYRGQQVHVVDNKNGWICIKTDAASELAIGWIPRFASFALNPDNKSVIEKEMKDLIDSGFVIDVNPSKNEAWVDFYEWKISDDATIQGKSRLMAYYCGQQKNSRLYWVSIRDALSGKRLAEYSESKGFKAF